MGKKFNGKVTIESGQYKATFDVTEDHYGQIKTKIDLKPEINLEEQSNEANFVRNLVDLLKSCFRCT